MLKSREETLAALRARPELPVLIVGGGINGISTFRELAVNGFDCLLVERADYGSGASAASSHMAHGGIRYLENGEFRLVKEALLERNRLLRNAPHAVKPLPTTVPMFKVFSGLLNAPLKFLGLLDKPSERGLLVIRIGLILYDFYARRLRVMPTHRVMGKAESIRAYPGISPDVLATATYYDGFIPYPERLCVELVMDAQEAHPGALSLNYLSMLGIEGGKVRLRDEISGEIITVKPQVLINATGPWIDLANDSLGARSSYIGGTKGSHLLLDHPELRKTIGDHEFFFENKDGRIVLILPYFDRVMVGTTDIYIENPDDAVCDDAEMSYILDLIERVFPGMRASREQIVFTFCGVRPLPDANAKSAGQVSRDHSIEVIEAGPGRPFPVLSLVGGKWTSFRAFGEQTADAAMKRLGVSRWVETDELAIGGGLDYPLPDEREAWVQALAAEQGLPMATVAALFDRYGTRALDAAAYIAAGADAPLKGCPDHSRRELMWLAVHEGVQHLDDLLLRRTLIAMRGYASPEVIMQAAEAVGKALGWDSTRIAAEVSRSLKTLKERHRVEYGME